MHRQKRKALADRLLGTADRPGPIDVGWLKARYGITGTTIQRWRKSGISADRADDLVQAIEEALDTTKEPLHPQWVERLLGGLMTLEDKAGITDLELADAEAKAAVYLASKARGRP
jgi:hypothetical protein